MSISVEDFNNLVKFTNTLQERVAVLEADAQKASSSSFAKPVKPETFSGRRDGPEVDRWLFQLKQYFEFTKMKDKEQVPYAALLLRDNAATWWQVRIQSAEQRLAAPIKDWDDFAQALKAQFKPANATERARDRLANAKQTSSIRAYNDLIRSLALEIPDIQETELLDRYKRGLKPHIKKEVILCQPTSLEKAMSLADEVDSILYEPGHARTDGKHHGNPKSKQHNQGPKKLPHDGATPMDLDQGQTKPQRFQGTCFTCGAQGHMAKNCHRRKDQHVSEIVSEHGSDSESGKEEPQ
jgi:hypothetical protein